jgi:surface protein
VVGSQAFYYASAFNANIGGWNTASVTTLSSVCAPSAVAQPGLKPRQMWAWPGAHVGERW